MRSVWLAALLFLRVPNDIWTDPGRLSRRMYVCVRVLWRGGAGLMDRVVVCNRCLHGHIV